MSLQNKKHNTLVMNNVRIQVCKPQEIVGLCINSFYSE